MARTDPQMNLHVPTELKEKIKRAAFENNRTITAEAVARLEKSFDSDISSEEVPYLLKQIYELLQERDNQK